ncbi:hypothetical protein Q765_07060 [Flavobacterium rivuli WB 3.3-2 = DSM 21788]|uniref:Gliding motility protein GldH n=1 Tax=Flavobacterium rivuli WB 3.3-2 = DSM 21788 TaxID=1121895 RepID=A0A0A2M434_9FLAO|nr:hypothetical protein [Flavobacterium rivuli]KGO87417.1 hypothetical protein Q765_07060 [Flavobacterium rivuli WB 3.3-2 = DSM 21788]
MKKIIALILLFAFASCSKFTLSKTIEDFPGNRWEQKDVKSFEFDVKEDMDADVAILFSHVDDPQYDKVPLEVTIEGPLGEKENIAVMLRLKDASGKEYSDCVGDVCDLTTVVKEIMPLKKGKYVFTIKNLYSQHSYLPNVLALGISLETVTHK